MPKPRTATSPARTKRTAAAKTPATRKQPVERNRRPATPPVTRLMRIRALDPHAACGRGTTVMQLFRVDELPTAHAATHLVFFDRHGWYCEHGRHCPAVDVVRKQTKQTS